MLYRQILHRHIVCIDNIRSFIIDDDLVPEMHDGDKIDDDKINNRPPKRCEKDILD